MKIGDRVRYSGYALQSKRDWWQECGTEPAKTRRKDAYYAEVAKRGTVTALLPGDPSRGVSPGVEVTWDDGSKSQSIAGRVEVVVPAEPQ